MTISRAVAPSALLAVLLAGCPTAPQPDPIPPSPKIAKFTATPASVTPGQKTTLDWEVSDATTVTIADVARGDVSGVDNKLSGSVMVTPTTNALYVLSAVNARGAKATAVASVTVAGADASKLLFAAYPDTIAAGGTGTLVWSAPGAKAVTITPMGGAALDLKGQIAAGTVEISPTAGETTYTLDADGQTRTVTVKREVDITELVASKKLALVGDMVTISWKSAYGTKAVLSSPGRGELSSTTTAAEVANGSFADTIPTVANGTVLNYLLDVEGPAGSVRKTISVVVGGDPLLTEATAPEYVKTGGTFSLTWKSANADAIQVRSGATVVFETSTATASGSVMLSAPAMRTTYTVAALSFVSGASSTKDLTVDPVGTVSAMPTFTVTPTAIVDGGTAATLSWNVPNARQLSVLQDGVLTVVAVKGPAAETGTATVYPNALDGGFVLTATNTIDAPVTASVDVTVQAPAVIGAADGGLLFEAEPSATLSWPFGTELVGVPHGDIQTTTTSTTFDDIAMTGKALTFGSSDNSTVSFTPFAFETWLYGTRFGGLVSVSIDGHLRLGSTAYTGAAPATFPSTSNTNVLVPFWADLELGPNGKVLWEVKGTAPNQELIVQWDKVRIKPQANSSLTFQARVSQGGVVTFEWKTLDNLPATYTVVTGVAGTAARGLAGVATAGGKQVFFGPKSAPATLPTALIPFTGFVKVGTSLARLSMPATNLIRAADFAITEVNFAPPMTVTAGEWFEVSNTSRFPIDLQGWTIDFGAMSTHTIASPVVVAPNGGRVVLGQSTNAADNDGVTVAYGYGATFAMPDTMGTLGLRLGNVSLTATWNTGLGGTGVSAMFDGTPLLDASGGFNTRLACSARANMTYGTQMPQQLGNPGADASCFPRASAISGSFYEIATTGTQLTPNDPDDGVATIDISSAPLTIEGQTITTLTACTNGFIVTGTSTNTAYTNKSAPSTSAPLGTIAPFWDDLRFISRTGEGLFYRRMAAGDDPQNPLPHWIVEWKNIEHYNSGDDLSFQVKFFDSGVIEYHYATMTPGSTNYANGSSATVWLENLAGTAAQPFSINQPNITPNSGVRFAHVP